MGARVLHAQQPDDAAPVATVSTSKKPDTGYPFSAEVVRLLSNPERERRTAAFALVCDKYGAASRIARAWGVSRTFVLRVRDGQSPLTDERIRALPDAQRRHLFEVLADTAQLSLPGFE